MAVAVLYVIRPSGDDERARRLAERETGRVRVRARYAVHLAERVGLDDAAAGLVMAVLFDHLDQDGEPCRSAIIRRCPRMASTAHDAGFDCPCTWDAQRRELERIRRRRATETCTLRVPAWSRLFDRWRPAE